MDALTICIPTIPARRSLLSRLLFQISLLPPCEVLVADGDEPMGDKLNAMFARATGVFVVAVDDDDLLSADYASHFGPTLAGSGLDFVGYDILWLENGRFAGIVTHSLDGDPLWRSLDRGVSPKCPVRTEIARRHEFGNEYTADRHWSAAVHDDCEHGAYIPAPLYVYDHWDQHMVGTSPDDPRYARHQRDVGMWPFDQERITWM